jgi:hypothetical protein
VVVYQEGGDAININVVTAHAGTHTPCPLFRHMVKTFSHNDRPWIWVPARGRDGMVVYCCHSFTGIPIAG